MKKTQTIILLAIVALMGCMLNRNSRYTEERHKTKIDDVVITGTVYGSNKNSIGLPGVSIRSNDNKILSTTDRNGKYKFRFKAGKASFSAIYIGYMPGSSKMISMIKGDSIVLDFHLKNSEDVFINQTIR